MTLEETIRTLEAVALQQQSVAMVIDNDIFKLNTIPNAKYAVFAYTQGEHLTSVSGDLATYRLTLFYVDRLLADKSNQTQIQSTGTQVLRNILTMMSELDFQVDNMPIQPFTQQFVDECAGVYCAVSIGAANGCECMPGFTEVLRKLNAATDKANEAADRANALADNPPKIVLNDQGYFWAFYDEDTKQYVTSQYRADDGTIVQQVEGSAVSLDVKGGTMYVCGELTSLTIASVDNSTKPSIIRFTSGATATKFSYPEDFNITGWTKPEENKSYTICVLFGAGNMTYDE